MIKKNLLTIVCLLFVAVSYTYADKGGVVCVADFNAVPDSYEDAVTAVANAIEECRKTGAKVLSFPQGRYDFWPDKAEKKEYFVSNTSTEQECPSKMKTIGLLLENIKDLTIEGNGSLFMFHGKMITWALDGCENITIRNVKMDFERPTMSEMTFREINPDYAIVDVHPDSWYDIKDGKLQFYGEGWAMKRFHAIMADTVGGRLVYSSWGPIQNSKVTEIAPLTLKLEGDFSKTHYAPGKILTIRDPYRDQVGAFVNLSKNVNLENVTMHYMHGLGIVSQFSENLTYKKVKVVPSQGRAISGFADGMHFSGCRGDVLIEECHFKGMHDDPVNVHGTYLQITDIVSPTRAKIRFMHGQTYGFPAFYENDTVAFVTAAALQTKGLTTIKSAKLVSERDMEVEFTSPIPKDIAVKDVLENLTWTPSLTVRNNLFEQTNTRGILITTPRKVVVEDNVFYRTGMYSILIAGDVNSWFESGAVTDVLIRNNSFIECGFNQSNCLIGINPENHTIVPKHWVHRNIRIEDNIFKSPYGAVITAKSVDGLTFTGNGIEVANKAKDGSEVSPIIYLNNCTDVDIHDNVVESGMPLKVECVNMVKKDVKADVKPVIKK